MLVRVSSRSHVVGLIVSYLHGKCTAARECNVRLTGSRTGARTVVPLYVRPGRTGAYG